MIYNEEKRVLTASEGMVLTNGEAYSSVGGKVHLGVNSNVHDWHEITVEEYNSRVNETEGGYE